MIVLITSLTEKRVRSHPQSAPAKAPAMAPAPRTAEIAATWDQRARWIPQAVAASAPNSNWPSAPMFHIDPEKARLTLNPVNTSGVAFSSVSATASQSPNAPLSSAVRVTAGLAPNAASPMASRPIATAIAANGLTVAEITGDIVDFVLTSQLRIQPNSSKFSSRADAPAGY